MIWTIIQKTAWPMTPPVPWSAFHIFFLLTGLTAAVGLTRLLCPPLSDPAASASGSKSGLSHTPTKAPPAVSNVKGWPGVSPGKRRPRATPGISDIKPTGLEKNDLVLFVCGITLTLGEIYKQLFLYAVVNQGFYDWWYFPFQLCSTPMYLCLVFPFLPHGQYRQAAAVYLQSFGFLGGIMALLEPSGLMHPYWTLTLHGLLWHILLVFLALYCTASGLAGKNGQDFVSALLLFFLFCLIATGINLFTGGRADMFYISPYYPLTQVVFREISLALGIWPGIGIYLASICLGAYLSRRILEIIFRN